VRSKKYANRGLYKTATSFYVTLDYLAQMVREGQDFTVEDAKTGEDITRSVLTQIIVEEESKGQTMLPINFLRQLIGMYGNSVQALVPQYLETAMNASSKNQEQLGKQRQAQLGGIFPFEQLEEKTRQNTAIGPAPAARSALERPQKGAEGDVLLVGRRLVVTDHADGVFRQRPHHRADGVRVDPATDIDSRQARRETGAHGLDR